MAPGQDQLRGTCAGCGGRSERPEPELTDVELLTDVSGTDAGSAQACAAVLAHMCVLAVCVWTHSCVPHIYERARILFCVCGDTTYFLDFISESCCLRIVSVNSFSRLGKPSLQITDAVELPNFCSSLSCL